MDFEGRRLERIHQCSRMATQSKHWRRTNNQLHCLRSSYPPKSSQGQRERCHWLAHSTMGWCPNSQSNQERNASAFDQSSHRTSNANIFESAPLSPWTTALAKVTFRSIVNLDSD